VKKSSGGANHEAVMAAANQLIPMRLERIQASVWTKGKGAGAEGCALGGERKRGAGKLSPWWRLARFIARAVA
jgi:hypothetical protein